MRVIRMTKSVNSLLNLFEFNNEAIAIGEFINRLSPSMNRTTVYRILDRLENAGLIYSFISNGGVKWYSVSKNNNLNERDGIRHHFQCKVCEKSECLTVDIPIPKLENYKVESASLLLSGTCEKCHKLT